MVIVCNPFITKLDRKIPLLAEEKDALAALLERRSSWLPARKDMYVEGDPVTSVRIILEGWACRYNQLQDGRRQIVELLLPGDIMSQDRYLTDRQDHAACAISQITYARCLPGELEELEQTFPRIKAALHWNTSISAGIQRQWIRALGRLDACQRIAHLFCELFYRSASIGAVHDNMFRMPMGQRDVGDATGLSTVQVNRKVKALRQAGLLSWRSRTVRIIDLAGLAKVGLFSPEYLDLDSVETDLDAIIAPNSPSRHHDGDDPHAPDQASDRSIFKW